MEKTTGYAVLGCGYFGSEFARAVSQMPGARLAAVYSPGESAGRVSRELGCPRAATLEQIWQDPAVDAVIVATPNYLHKEHVMAAARAGKHVFCEKPFALNTADARAMVECCRAQGVKLMVGHIMHFYSGIARLKTMIDEGQLGRLMTVHIERTGWEHRQAAVSWKKMQAASGGHLFHHIHEIDILQWIMGQPATVYAVGGNLGHQSGEFGDEDDVLLVTLRFAGGGFATMQYGSGFRMGNHIVRINGTLGGALIDFQNARIQLKLGDETSTMELFDDPASAQAIRALFQRTDGGVAYGRPDERPPEYILNALRSELAAFDRCVRTGFVDPAQADLFDGSSACNSVQIAEYSLRSRQQGQPLEFGGKPL